MTAKEFAAPEAFTLWLTGLPGSGKTTLARELRTVFYSMGRRVELLDGDAIRETMSPDLGFTRCDRTQNVRRIGYIARLLSRNGVIVIAAVISPYRQDRNDIRREHEVPFVETWIDCSLEALVERDPKGLYRKALGGELTNLTGLGDPYEPPEAPDIHVRTDANPIEECVFTILVQLERLRLISADAVLPWGRRQ